MEFLKHNYEKVLLAGLLLLFIGSMCALLITMKRTGKLTAEDLKLPHKDADFEKISENDPVFDFEKQMFEGIVWERIEPRNEEARYSTDMVIPFAAARCGHCNRIIPYYYFNGNRCCPWSECGKPLAKPPMQVAFRSGIPTKEDPDGCGIPHDIKMSAGMYVEDPASVLDDQDGDGFSNLYEYKYSKKINEDSLDWILKAKKHPPMWHRLVVVETGKVKLSFTLSEIRTNGEKDKSRWEISFAEAGKNRPLETMLGDSVGMGIDMNVKDVTEDSVTLEVPGVGETLVRIGEQVVSPKPLAKLQDVAGGKYYLVEVGDTVSVGERKAGISRYDVKKIDWENREVQLSENVRGEDKDLEEAITARGKISFDERVREAPAGRMGQDDLMM